MVFYESRDTYSQLNIPSQPDRRDVVAFTWSFSYDNYVVQLQLNFRATEVGQPLQYCRVLPDREQPTQSRIYDGLYDFRCTQDAVADAPKMAAIFIYLPMMIISISGFQGMNEGSDYTKKTFRDTSCDNAYHSQHFLLRL